MEKHIGNFYNLKHFHVRWTVKNEDFLKISKFLQFVTEMITESKNLYDVIILD